jgi:Ca2+-binding EF-hand superfamily protein
MRRLTRPLPPSCLHWCSRSQIREWDPNGDGTITKQEFRLNVRKLFPKDTPPKVQDIDALFQSLDDDGSGSLDVAELKAALKKLQDTAASSKAGASLAQERAGELRARAAELRNGVLAATIASERALEELQQLQRGTLRTKLGELLVAKGVKMGDIVAKWDRSGDGEIDKAEFRREVIGLGVENERASEIDALFDELDGDGGGTLDLNEVKASLRKLQEGAEGMKDALRTMGLSYIASLKATRKAQTHFEAEEKEASEARKT